MAYREESRATDWVVSTGQKGERAANQSGNWSGTQSVGAKFVACLPRKLASTCPGKCHNELLNNLWKTENCYKTNFLILVL